MKRNTNLSLRKPEGLSRARAEGLNRGEVVACFNLLATVLEEHNPIKFITWMSRISVSTNAPKKIVSAKGKREAVFLTNVERGENVTLVACFIAAGTTFLL
jgi:hypothetical protein